MKVAKGKKLYNALREKAMEGGDVKRFESLNEFSEKFYFF